MQQSREKNNLSRARRLPAPRPLSRLLKRQRPPLSETRYTAELSAMGRHWVEAWKDVLRLRALPQDVLAGITVAAVALPLNLALAVASGLPPSAGLIAGVVGGGLAAMMGGSPLQVTGPAAALSTLVLALVAEFGVVGAAAAAMAVGGVQVLLALGRAGKLMKYVPESVLAGFTTGVGLKLLDQQIPELLGFDYRVAELAQMVHRPEWLLEVSWLAALSGLAVAFLLVATRQFKRFPAALVGVGIVTALASYLGWDIARVGEVPSSLPAPSLPAMEGRWLELVLKSLPLALLAAAESLLSARIVDRMAPHSRPHQPNLELLGQGVANVGAGLMGGMPVTGVVVRSGVNVQSGGRTRLSALIHSGSLLFVILYLSDQISKVPLAGLAGLLIVIGVRLLEVGTLRHLWKEERVEAVAFLVTAAGTVSGHLVAGLAGGMVLHAVGAWLHRRKQPGETAPSAEQKKQGVRAVLSREHAEARRPSHLEPAPHSHGWLRHIQARPLLSSSSYVHPKAAVIGRVVLGDHVHIAAGSSVRADEGTPFYIGANSNIQDGVVIHALKERKVVVGGEEWAVYVGKNVSMAHDALVHGPCYIGDDTFVGFKAVVHDSIVGSHCYIGIGAVVVGVEVPDGRFVPHGSIVDTAEKAERLPPVSEAHREFNEDVVDVNRGLAAAYRAQVGGGRGPAHARMGSGTEPSAERANPWRTGDDRF
ncbi:SulP family inorganic anion transporter [Archangium sp.]|uniref:SulP family inorganic anion transporter n=1 Tax=Archangium sp. TaxID=1872627 RepID=UPI002D61D054|nr:SulP family inorganic anion transporter [Archangium sp.]HYO53001.1 SulP family inorganic anion transporter [Archangium sp.]